MANIKKTFNFRNGVQVDDDNFIVNPLGLVGIGTTVPTEALDVRGTVKVVGLVTANQIDTLVANVNILNVGIATFANIGVGSQIIGAGVSIRNGIVTSSTGGIVTYYGDGGKLLNLPTSQWLDIDVGLGFTSIYAQGFVGIATNDPRYSLQIGGNNNLGSFVNGVGIESTGNILATGIITAGHFSGIGSNITLIDANNISSGTISTDRIPTLTNSKLPSDINVSGIITSSGFVGNFLGIATGTFIGNLTGIATFARDLTGTPDIEVNEITATGDVTAPSAMITNITSTDVNISNSLTANLINVGSGGTIFSLLQSGRLGIGTTTPTADIQVVKTGSSSLEVIGSNSSQLIIGQQQTPDVGIGTKTGIFRFGNDERTLDIINADSGDLNLYLHLSPTYSGITTGSFNWIYGQTLSKLMTLTYDGNLGLGITDPTNRLEVVGVSTVTSDSYVGNDLYVAGGIYGTFYGTLSGDVTASEVYSTSGISTVYDLQVQNIAQIQSIGIGTTNPITSIDAQQATALLSAVGLGTTNPRVALDVNGQILSLGVGIGTDNTQGNGLVISDESIVLNNTNFTASNSIFNLPVSVVGIGTTIPRSNLHVEGNIVSSSSIGIGTFSPNATLDVNGSLLASFVGVGTTNINAAVDFSSAGNETSSIRYMLPPKITTAERIGLSTIAGAFIFNVDNGKFQGYTGIAWTDFN